jgi:DNA polymerase III subunit epsilon
MSLLETEKFICIDCETTGLDPKEDRIIEFAVMLFDLNEIYSTLESLIDPERPISEASIAIHHITPEMVANKPKIESFLPEIIALIKNHTIIGHGVGFDIELIANAADRQGIPHTLRKNKVLDTLRMARLYGDCPVNSLEQLRKHFNIPMEGAHRAMNDVVVNREVFRHLGKRYKTTRQLFDALSKPILMKTIPLGKHKGRPFKEIPLQYLHWMSTKEFDQDLEFSIKTELKRRKQGNGFNQVGNPFLDL